MSDEQGLITVDRDSIIAKLVLKGDVSGLRPREKVAYYMDFCKAIGLNPVTRPFEYIVMKGKEVLYATKSATDQLRKRDGISITDSTTNQVGDIYMVTVKASNAQGRTDVSTGALNVKDLFGDDLANALMKCETKAKRRVTLSICGLGMMDETEIETTDAALFATDDELKDGRAKIYQLFEDGPNMSTEFRMAQIDDADLAVTNRDITALELIYTETKHEMSKDAKRETKAREPESILEATGMIKASKLVDTPVDVALEDDDEVPTAENMYATEGDLF